MIQPMFDPEKLRANLAILMAGISANELWRKSGVQQTTISRILAGKIDTPKIDQLCKLAEYFGVTVSQLIGELPMREPPPPSYAELERELDSMPAHRRLTAINIVHTIAMEPDAPYQ